MKKTVITVLMCAFILALFSLSAYTAEKELTFSASVPASAKQNDEFTISFDISASVNVSGYKLVLEFNPEYVEISEFPTAGAFLSGAAIHDIVKTTENSYAITASNFSPSTTYTGTGTLVTVKCKAVKAFASSDIKNILDCKFPDVSKNCLKWTSSTDTTPTPATTDFTLVIPMADTAALSEVIARAKNLIKADYSISSFASMSEALRTAESFTSAAYADKQPLIDNAASVLSATISNLKPTYTTALREALRISEQYTEKNYTSETFSVLKSAITGANSELTKEAEGTTTDAAIISATNSLKSAISGLIKSEYKKLTDLIALIGTPLKEDYTAQTFDPFSSALSDAKSTLSSSSSGETDYKAVLNILANSFSALRFRLYDITDNAKSYNDTSKYSTATLAVLNKAISNAEKVLADSSSVKKDRDNCIEAISEAIDGLRQSPAIPLRTIVAEAKNLNRTDYSEASYSVLSDAVSKAEKRLENGATDELYTSSSKEISDAIEALKESPRITLSRTINNAKEYRDTDYSTATFNALTKAINDADEIVKDITSTESNQNTARQNIEKAISALSPKPSGILRELMKTVNLYDGTKYSPSSFEILSAACNTANTLLEENTAPDEDFENAMKAINDAVEALESRLPDVLSDAKSLDSEIYTPETYTSLLNAILKAEEVLSADSSLFDMEKCITDIEASKSALLFTEREKLRQVIESVKDTDVSPMSNASAKAFREALLEAGIVLSDMQKTDEEITAISKLLTDSLASLEVSCRNDLKTAIESAETIEEDKFTSDTFSVLSLSVENAKAVLSDTDATEDEYRAAITDLLSAVSGLKDDTFLSFIKNPQLKVYLLVTVTTAVIILLVFFITGAITKRKAFTGNDKHR